MNKWLQRHGMFLGVIIGIIVTFIATICVYLHSNDWTATGTVALAGFGAIGILFSYITMSQMKSDKRPYVSVDIVQDEIAHVLFSIEVRNIGNAPAHNITIKIEPPAIEEEMLKKNAIFSKINDLSIVNHPVLFLPMDQHRFVRYGVGHMMYPFVKDGLLYKVQIEYEDSAGKIYKDNITFDPSYLMGTTSADNPDVAQLKEISKNLNNILKELKSVAESEKIQSGIYGYCKIHNQVANNKTGDCIICRCEKQDQKKADEENNSENTIDGGEV